MDRRRQRITEDMGNRVLITLSRTLRIIALAVALTGTAIAQNVAWSNHYGGVYNEGGYACVQTSDGGYAAVGSTFSYGHGDHDVYLVRLDSLGDTLWTHTYGGLRADYGHDICLTRDSGFLLIGTTLSFGRGAEDLYLICTNRWGDTLWTRTYGGTLTDEGWSVRPTSDSGFIVAGTTSSSGAGNSDVWLVKVNQSGDSLWGKTYGGSGGESGFAVRETPDRGFILTGATGSFGQGYSSVYAVRTDSQGDTLWTTTYGGSRADLGYSVENALDGGFIFVGATASWGLGYYDAYVVKTDGSGSLEWDRYYGGTKDDRAYAVAVTPDGGYIVVGTTESFGAGSVDLYAIKVDPVGSATWTHPYGGSQADYCRSVLVNGDGNYVLAGYTYSFTAGGSDLYLLTIDSDQQMGVYEPQRGTLPSGFDLAQNYPNPFNQSTHIEFTLPHRSNVTLTIYNLLGQVVKQFPQENLPAGTFSLEWDGLTDRGATVASGIYFYRISTDEFAAARKMLLLK